MRKSDFLAALIIGEVSAWLALAIFKNVRLEFSAWLLPVFLPILSVIGLWIAYFISKRFLIIWQAAKFLLVGVLNTFVDLGALNLLILASGIATGFGYSVFKGISFIVAVINSYFWNKFWTFKKSATGQAGKPAQILQSKIKAGREFTQFFIVSAIGFGINVGIASLVVNLIGPRFDITEKIWANIGAIFATFFAMVWNFLGYKFIVFK